MKEYEKMTRSVQAFNEASRYMVGGVNSPVRAFRGVDQDPVFIERGNGSKIYDIDGNEYIDYVCSWGALILGHCNEEVSKAVEAALLRGSSFGAPTLAETQLAKKIVSAFPSVEKVRLVSSGTEAVMSAIRLARGYTQKNVIIKMAGCYHGHSDSLLVQAGSGLAENSTASSKGVPEEIAALTLVVPYNDIEALKKAFQTHKGKIAAVLTEPIAANMGVILPKTGYLQSLRHLCDNENAVLIFDEVITGLRVAFGGAQQLYGIDPDMTCFGKIVGAGLPCAGFGGKTQIMDLLSPLGPVYQAGTLSGNPLATAAAIAAIDILSGRGVYEKLERSAARLEAGLLQAAKETGVNMVINRAGSLMSCFFTSRPVENFSDVQSTDICRFKTFFANMLKQGIYLAPSAFEAMFVSLAHSEQDIDRTIEAAFEGLLGKD